MVWLCGSAVVIALALLFGLVALLTLRGTAYFWPQPLQLLQSSAPGSPAYLGWVVDRETSDSGVASLLLYRGAREQFADSLVWIDETDVTLRSRPGDALAVERRGEDRVFGFFDALVVDDGLRRFEDFGNAARLEAVRQALGLQAGAERTPGISGLRLRLSTGRAITIPVVEVLAVSAPNAMSFVGKVSFFSSQIATFLREAPRRGNVQGGVFPAILGTVTLVLLMTVIVSPLGVLAAVYLQEYAQRGPVTQLVRIAVNNLAGVPSIVYGVFGLGFFVYTVGGSLDSLLFAERLPAPTLGAPGLLWAALTMALLTLPVVVVTTEEGLARVPAALREGSYALGSTRAETLWRVVLPAASPAVLTGLILAVARATGEVAPLLLVGVAKYSPGLPIDGEFPYLHLDRQFMHLGFYIYDLGFQSPELVTAEGLVFATALLLVLIVFLLNFVAVILRGRLREAFRPDATL